MQRIVMILAALMMSTAVVAQQSTHREWMGDFTSVSLSGNMKVKMVRISDSEQPMLVVNTTDESASRLSYTIDDNGVLKIRESNSRNRTVDTDIEIRFRTVDGLKIAGSRVEIDGELEVPVRDIEVSGSGTLKGSVKATDLKLTVSGQSDVDLTGEARYLKLDVSAADIDLSKLEAMSAEVTATQRGEATVRVSERLVATTNLGGTVFYKEHHGTYRHSRNQSSENLQLHRFQRSGIHGRCDRKICGRAGSAGRSGHDNPAGYKIYHGGFKVAKGIGP